jgi:hypothetical protein
MLKEEVILHEATEIITPPCHLQELYATANLRVIRTNVEHPKYQDILFVRSQVYKTTAEETRLSDDLYAELYCAYLNDQPIASLRTLRASRCHLDCEQYYPNRLMLAFRNQIGSASRLCSMGIRTAAGNTGRLLINLAWVDQIALGSRIDVINVKLSMINYYKKLGYYNLSDSFFIHPSWNTPSCVMLIPVDDEIESPLQKIFSLAKDPIRLIDIEKHVKICKFKTERFPRGYICSCIKSDASECSLVQYQQEDDA